MRTEGWDDERVRRYERSGRHGWIHHEYRNAATDDILDQAAAEVGYDHEEMVGLLVSKVGRHAGDEFSFDGAEDRIRALLSRPETRVWCRDAAAAYSEEIAREIR